MAAALTARKLRSSADYLSDTISRLVTAGTVSDAVRRQLADKHTDAQEAFEDVQAELQAELQALRALGPDLLRKALMASTELDDATTAVRPAVGACQLAVWWSAEAQGRASYLFLLRARALVEQARVSSPEAPPQMKNQESAAVTIVGLFPLAKQLRLRNLSASKCFICGDATASPFSLICTTGHTCCASCFAASIHSRLGSSAYGGCVLACLHPCGAPSFTTEAVQRVLSIALSPQDADDALADLNLLTRQSLEAETRRAVTRELKRNPPTLESQLVDYARVVRCPDCDAPYDETDPNACMHLKCFCGRDTCGHCFKPQEECRTEQCLFNPDVNSIMGSNKAVAFCILKALNITKRLHSVPAAQRIAALDAPAVRVAFADAGLDSESRFLVKDLCGYADGLIFQELAVLYGGKDGKNRVLHLNKVVVGDYVEIEKSVAQLRHLCTNLPRGGAKGFNPIMAQLAGATVKVTCRDDKRRLIAVALPPGASEDSSWNIPFDAVVKHFTPADLVASVQESVQRAAAKRARKW